MRDRSTGRRDKNEGIWNEVVCGEWTIQIQFKFISFEVSVIL